MAASLRSGLLSARIASGGRPWLQLERQFSLLRVATPTIHNGIGIGSSSSSSNGTKNNLHKNNPLIQTRQNSSSSGSDITEAEMETLTRLAAQELFGKDGVPSAGSEGGDISSGDIGSGDFTSGNEGGGMVLRRGGGPSRDGRLYGHARVVPVSPSYFSKQPRFDDSRLKLQDLMRKCAHLPQTPPEKIEPVAWKASREYYQTTGEKIKASDYNQCLSIAKKLHRVHPSLRPPGLVDAINGFKRSIHPFVNKAKPLVLDRFGRALGVGRRKTSTARAWVVEGTGEVLVNGKTLTEIFGRVHDRESAVWALRASDRSDKYNVWALVKGGGTTGQAEALTLAIAKGLIAHEPALKTPLRKAGCVARDPRMVERKKHGRVKARKMPAWVKR